MTSHNHIQQKDVKIWHPDWRRQVL